MQEIRERVVAAIKGLSLGDNHNLVLSGLYSEDLKSFPIQESLHWDYKDRFPDKLNDDYFGGILRLICAFNNTYGGIIIFGVHDKQRTPGHNKQKVDIERLNAVVAEKLNNKIECIHRNYRLDSGSDSDVDVLLIPKRPMGVPPTKFRHPIGKYRAGTIWGRFGHQVLAVTPSQLPLFYHSRDDYGLEPEFSAKFTIHKALPPSPATMKQFIGRSDLMDDLWQWLVFDEEPRLFLHGPGGSGKSTLAYEFAHAVAESGRHVKTASGYSLDFVTYLSAKETELNPASGKIQNFSACDFADAEGQFRAILVHSGLSTEAEVLSLSGGALKEKLKELFNSYHGLLIIDDIDALTRRRTDPGMDTLLQVLLRARPGGKVLYTLRNAPTMSLNNAIKVPGLNPDTEYLDFVDVCCKQFKVPIPPSEFIVGEMENESDRLPLVVETIIALKRTSSNYKEALSLYQTNKGDNARKYLYQREYDGLPADNRGRHLLAALAAFDRPVSFESLRQVLRFSEDQLSDAIGEVSEIFMNADDAASPDTLFSLLPVTKKFIDSVSDRLDMLPMIKARVDYYRSNLVIDDPRITTLKLRVSDFLRDDDADGALKYLRSVNPAPEISEHPHYQALMGQVLARLKRPLYEEARSAFQFAYSAGYRDVSMMRDWFHMEFSSGFNLPNAQRVCDMVLDSKDFGSAAKSEFLSKRGQVYRRQAKTVYSFDTDKCLISMRRAVQCYMDAAEIGFATSSLDPAKSLEWANAAIGDYINAMIALRRPLDIFEFFREEMGGTKHRMDVIVDPVVRYFPALLRSDRLDDLNRRKGALFGLLSNLKAKDAYRFSERGKKEKIIKAVEINIDHIQEKIGSIS